jgi:serine/threonine-protein kinase
MTALMYQIVNFAPPAPSALKAAVPEMLDAIVARMLAKAIEERYPSAAELARDLRACEKQLAASPAAPGREAAAPTFAPGTEHAALDTQAREAVLKQATVQTRREDNAASTRPEAPAHGLARAFDSNEATLRLAALTLTAAAQDPEAAPVAPRRRWSRRDTLAVAAAALAGLAVGAAILLA